LDRALLSGPVGQAGPARLLLPRVAHPRLTSCSSHSPRGVSSPASTARWHAVAATLAFTHAPSSLSRTRPLLLPLLLTSLSPPQRQRSAMPPHAIAPLRRRRALSPPCYSPILLAHGSTSTFTIPCTRSRPRFRHSKARAGVSPPLRHHGLRARPSVARAPFFPFPSIFFFDFALAFTSRTPRAPRLSSPWPGPAYLR
jgi:hypothetical protein